MLTISIWGVSYGYDTSYIDSIGVFHKIKLLGNIDAICNISKDSVGYMKYPDATLRERLFIKNNNGTLSIQIIQDSEDPEILPAIELFTDSLIFIENCYDGKLKIRGDVIAPSFQAKQQGNGIIEIDSIYSANIIASVTAGKGTIRILSGNCCTSKCRIMGAGTIDILGINSDKVICKFFGGGKILCYPVNYLSIFGVGSTKVYYMGSPEIDNFWNTCKRMDLSESHTEKEISALINKIN